MKQRYTTVHSQFKNMLRRDQNIILITSFSKVYLAKKYRDGHQKSPKEVDKILHQQVYCPLS